MTQTATAHVATPNGARYITQLCKHWAHKLDVDLAGSTGTVRFPGAVAVMAGAESGIDLTVTADDADRLGEIQGVIERHLDRFAFREAPLAYPWR